MPDPTWILPAGTPAPDFSLPKAVGEAVALSQFRGRPVVLVFYPADFSSVCGDQWAVYGELESEFARHDAQVLGISVDGVFCHAAYRESRSISFPLLSDFEPKGAVARRYGVYQGEWGVAERALFVIDAGGTIRWSHLSPMGENPGADGILAALDALEPANAG